MQSLLWKNATTFFVNIRPNLANKIPQNDLTFITTVNTTLNETVLSENKFRETFKLLNRKKSSRS